jgi:hypothetical protein
MGESLVPLLLVVMRSASTATKSTNGGRQKKIGSIGIRSSYSLFFPTGGRQRYCTVDHGEGNTLEGTGISDNDLGDSARRT